MAVHEPRRIELFERLSDLVGAEATRTLFELLPPPGQDVASHDDVVQVARGLRGEVATLGERIDASRNEVIATMHEEIGRTLIVQTRTTVFSMVAALAAIAALTLGFG